MSHPDLPLILWPPAEDDFVDILQYTLETWGEEQVFVYRAVPDKALLTIQQHPHIGHGRQELSSTHRIFPAGQHIIVYQINDKAVLCFAYPARAHGHWTTPVTSRGSLTRLSVLHLAKRVAIKSQSPAVSVEPHSII